MERPARLICLKGFLLIEAIVSAVVIAVGIAFVNRGLSSQLKAIRTVEEYETLLSLARDKVSEFEGQRLFGIPPPSNLEDAFEEPSKGYRWVMTFRPRPDMTNEEGEPLFADVSLDVRAEGRPSSTITLGAIWSADWLAQE